MTSDLEPHARPTHSWRALGAHLAAIPPRSVGRGLVAVTVGAMAVGLAAASWPALVPYLIGGLVAYASLPLVNTLDRFLPRLAASILALLVVIGLVGGFVYVVVPPLVTGLGRLAELIPKPGEVSGSLADIEAWIATLPEPMASVATNIMEGVMVELGGALDGFTDAVTQFIINQTLGLLSTLNFVFGLFILPVWMTSLMTSERVAKRQALTFLHPSVRADVLATARIMDRAASTFLRARLLLAVLTGLMVYAGIQVLAAVGFEVTPGAGVAIAAMLGVLQLIPELGFILGFLPILLVAAIAGPAAGAALAVVYAGSEVISARVADTRIKGGAADLPIVLLLPALVAMSQFGVLWLFLAAPIVGTVVDLARYAYGRLGDPPAPAGVIPGEATQHAVASAAAPVPSSYRHLAAKEGVTSA